MRTRVLGLLAAAAMLSGCSSMMLTGGGGGSRGTGDQSAPRSAPGANDAAISARVSARFAEDPAVSAAGLRVRTVDGNVTLSGSAGSYAVRNQAYRLARQVEGVRSVINQIRVEE